MISSNREDFLILVFLKSMNDLRNQICFNQRIRLIALIISLVETYAPELRIYSPDVEGTPGELRHEGGHQPRHPPGAL